MPVRWGSGVWVPEMSASFVEAERDLRAFVDRRSPEALLRRYCTLRARNFPVRLVLSAIGFVAILPASGSAVAVAAVLVVTLADLADCLVLRRCARADTLGARASALTALTAAGHAATVTGFVALLLIYDQGAATALAIAVCLAAMLDSALYFRLNRSAALARVLVLALALPLILIDVVRQGGGPAAVLPTAAACILLAYVFWAFFRQTTRARERAERRQHETLRAARDLAQARQTAVDAMQARNALFATVSHEIRTPLNGIVGAADLLAEGPLTPDQADCLRTISASGTALSALVGDVLDLSSLETGRLTIARLPFDPAEAVSGALDAIRPLARAKGLALREDWPPEPMPRLVGDGRRLQQVAVNLLGNAVKFTPAGEVGVSVALATGTEGRRLDLTVRDTGVGIAPESLDRIFESFVQADETVARHYGGSGLGLAISRRLVTAMGGTLSVSSTPGAGSEFRVSLTLPEATEPRPAPVPVAPRAELAAPGFARLPLLIADDNRANAVLLERMLAPLGPAVEHAADGRQAVERYFALRPALVFMDVRMPLLDGLGATRDIRRLEALLGTPPRPIIAITANASREDRDRCLAAGMTDVLSKPYRKANILEALHRHLQPGTDAGG